MSEDDLSNQIKSNEENKNTSINEEYLRRIEELEKKLKEKEESESKLQQEVSVLEAQIKLSNTTISNLTEEKENFESRVEELTKDNEKLKKDLTSNSFAASANQSMNDQNKKNEDETKALKKKIHNLLRDKDELEEVIMKQEETVSQLTKQINSTSRQLTDKDKELQENVLYTAKLTSIINNQKKELNSLKQSQKFEESTTALKEEIMKLKKDNETKQNKINLLQMNNKILKNKVNSSQAEGIEMSPPRTSANIVMQHNNNMNCEGYDLPPPSAGGVGRNKIILNKIKTRGEINAAFKNSSRGVNKFSIESKDSEQKAYIVAKAKSKPKPFKPFKKVNNEPNEDEILRKNQDLDNMVFKPIIEKAPKVDISADFEYPVYETKCDLGGSEPKNNARPEDKKEIEKLSKDIDNLLDQI